MLVASAQVQGYSHQQYLRNIIEIAQLASFSLELCTSLLLFLLFVLLITVCDCLTSTLVYLYVFSLLLFFELFFEGVSVWIDHYELSLRVQYPSSE